MGAASVAELPQTQHYVFDEPPPPERHELEFRLIYEGPLKAESSNPRIEDKHRIRRQLHPQLRQLWHQNDFLRRNINYFAENYKRNGYRFVPLVNQEQARHCALDILFLRRDAPGNLIAQGGDIDNRIKTLFDGLRMIERGNDLPDDAKTPAEDEDPFFCLLQDDKLVTELKVTTDRLLLPLKPGERENDVVLIIHVRTGHIDLDELFPVS